MKVKIKKLSDKAIIPLYGTEYSAGMDITCTKVRSIEEMDHGYVEYGTDLAFEIPQGYVGLLFPRSSITKKGLILGNSVGVIDSDYRGEVTFRFKHIRGGSIYEIGDRIGQLIIIPYPKVEFEEVTELNNTIRGTGGYGSTGS